MYVASWARQRRNHTGDASPNESVSAACHTAGGGAGADDDDEEMDGGAAQEGYVYTDDG